jgi:deoxycytidylate deaminase
MGYSGPPVGLPNDSCRSDTDACGCAHAEVNALLRAVTAEQMIMATTTSPCSQCAAAILNSCRVAMVVYRCSYRDEAARELLQAGGVIVTHATQQCVIDDTIVRMVSWDKETRNGWTRERP